MTAQEILDELSKLGNENTKRILINHGAREPFSSVRMRDLKTIQKAIKKDYHLSLELYDTGFSEAMYLAGLIADENKMTKKDLQNWAVKAYWYMISECTVAWIAAESNHGYEMALDWIESQKENVASSGWATLSSLVSIKQDAELKIEELDNLLNRVGEDIHNSLNRVRYTMNGFVISAGCYVSSLTDKALLIANQIGKVHVDMGGTACKVPDAQEYIEKVKSMGKIGKKRKMARC